MVELQSSPAAMSVIIVEEDSGQAYYEKHYTGFEWPQGASGPTIGIGYDCGYVSRAQAQSDWSPFVDAHTLAVIMSACGLKGDAARVFTRGHASDIHISWDVAIAQFHDVEMPKWEKIVRDHLPNTDKLNGDCFGTLVSLTYNRGPSYSMPGPRYAEMRNIKAHMASMNFDAIPGDLRAMSRLWPSSSGVHKRRFHEAALFEQGLAKGVTA